MYSQLLIYVKLYIISNELCTVDDGGNGHSPGTMSGIVGGGIVIIIIGGGMSPSSSFSTRRDGNSATSRITAPSQEEQPVMTGL